MSNIQRASDGSASGPGPPARVLCALGWKGGAPPATKKREVTVDNDRVISTLNRLIETVKDGEQGFTTAAEGLTDPQTKALYQHFSRDRA